MGNITSSHSSPYDRIMASSDEGVIGEHRLTHVTHTVSNDMYETLLKRFLNESGELQIGSKRIKHPAKYSRRQLIVLLSAHQEWITALAELEEETTSSSSSSEDSVELASIEEAERLEQASELLEKLILSLPQTTGRGDSLENEATDDLSCQICYDDLYADDSVVKHLPCGHSFHGKCIDCWLHRKTTCPLCRNDIAADSSI